MARSRSGIKRRKKAAKSSVVRDSFATILIIFAIVLLVSLAIPKAGIVTLWIANFLGMLFGTASVLLPLVILELAVFLLLKRDEALPLTVYLGIAITFLSVLTLVSVAQGGFRSGFIGNFLGQNMIVLFGSAISIIIAAGLILVSALMCGLPVSKLFVHVQEMRAQHKQEKRSLKKEEKDQYPKSLWRPNKHQSNKDETTYLGDRKTSVLARSGMRKEHPPLQEMQQDSGAYANSYDQTILLEEGEQDIPAGETVLLSGRGTSDFADQRDGEASESTYGEKGKEAGKRPKLKAHKRGDVQNDNTQNIQQSRDDASGHKRPGESEHASLILPSLDILTKNTGGVAGAPSDAELARTQARLQATLEEFNLKSKVKGFISGPLVTTFQIEMGEGERVNKITNLEDDIALALATTSVRIFAPIPGTSLVGIEIPNRKRTNVFLGDVLPFAQDKPLEIAVGLDSEGKPVIIDLASLPHLLVAGTTGSGKSVMLNAAIMSILMRSTPEQVRFILVDPKRVEFTTYVGLPHLYVPVVNEPQKAASALQWAVAEMVRRLKVFEKAGVRDIKAYNKRIDKGELTRDDGAPEEKIPYFVIVIDELADLMMVAGKDVEASIVRIAQLGRAAGIHLIIATQRPSADVVTGLIKANIDNRVALSVDNGMNSRIIIDQNGAEKLLGNGDMLVKLRGEKPRRIQGCYVSDPEVTSAISYIRDQVQPEYHDEILNVSAPATLVGGPSEADANVDPLFWRAAHVVVDSGIGSTSGIQRRLSVGYARAGRIMDMLEEHGIVGPPEGSKPREVLISEEELIELESGATLRGDEEQDAE